jgi:hypothetical protein
MAQLVFGKVHGGTYGDMEIVLNGTNLGELVVEEDDASGTLAGAINNVSGLSASVDGNGVLTVTSEDPLVVEGICPSGISGVTDHFVPGTYE